MASPNSKVIGLAIAGAVGVFAEVDASRIQTRLDQGWVNLVSSDLDEVFSRAEQARAAGEPVSIAYHGNIVDLLEAAIGHHAWRLREVDEPTLAELRTLLPEDLELESTPDTTPESAPPSAPGEPVRLTPPSSGAQISPVEFPAGGES